MKTFVISSLAAIPGLAILLAFCLANRIPAEAREQNCHCDACKFRRSLRMPKDKSIQEQIAVARAQEMEEMGHG